MSYLLFDLAIIVILVLFLWRGAAKGFVLSLCGLLAVIVAFVGATFLAGALAPRVGEALEPRFAQMIEERLDQQILDDGGQTPALPDDAAPAGETDFPLQDVLDVLRDMGLYEDLIGAIDQAVTDGMLDVAAGAAAAVAATIAQSVAYMVLFLAGFLLILLAWTLLSHALDLVTRLPGLNGLNKLGGAAMGLLKGCIFLFIAAWLLRFSGSILPEETVAQTHLLRFFLTTNPMTLLTGI